MVTKVTFLYSPESNEIKLITDVLQQAHIICLELFYPDINFEKMGNCASAEMSEVSAVFKCLLRVSETN